MSSSELKVLIFNINGEYYAVDIKEVERILGYEETTRLPESPDFVEGLINYEGGILPIISLAKRFNLGESVRRQESKIIVTKHDNEMYGIIVDVVSEVRDLKAENIEETPKVISGISRRYIKGLIKLDNRIIIFLNLANILTEEEKALL